MSQIIEEIKRISRIKRIRYSVLSILLLIVVLSIPWAKFSVGGEKQFEPDQRAVNHCITNSDSDLPQTRKLDISIEKFLREWHINGASFALAKDGKLIYAKGYGFADKEIGDSMQVKHILRVASVSKLITAAGIMKLQEQGKLHLSDKVFGKNGILSDSIYLNIRDRRTLNITIEHLLRHTAGFSLRAGDPMFCVPDVARSLGISAPIGSEDMIGFALNRQLGFSPGQGVSYSNLGYMILSMIIEKISGQAYEQYVKKNVLEPAGCFDMHIARNTYEEKYPHEVRYYEPSNADMIESYDGTGRMAMRSNGGNDIAALQGAGAWVGSAVEILKFANAIDGRGKNILNNKSIRELTQIKIGSLPIGWINIQSNGTCLRTGTLAGTSAVIKHLPNGITWVFITNTSSWTGSKFPRKIDAMITQSISQIKDWPSRDMFDPYFQSVTDSLK